MNLQELILEKFSLDKSHKRFCSNCFSTTAATDFWIWDPADDSTTEKKFAQILLQPDRGQRNESLNVRTEKSIERTFVALDKCLFHSITDGLKKCEGLLYFEKKAYWIELKMNASGNESSLNLLVENAIDKIVQSRNQMLQKQIDFSGFHQFAHIAIPKSKEELSEKSDGISDLTTRLRKQERLTLKVKSVLLL